MSLCPTKLGFPVHEVAEVHIVSWLQLRARLAAQAGELCVTVRITGISRSPGRCKRLLSCTRRCPPSTPSRGLCQAQPGVGWELRCSRLASATFTCESPAVAGPSSCVISSRWCIGIRSVPCHMTQRFVWIIRDVSSTACSHKVVSIECCQACLIQASCQGYKSSWEKVVKDAGTDAVRHAGIVDLSQNVGDPHLHARPQRTACLHSVCVSLLSTLRLVTPMNVLSFALSAHASPLSETLLHDDLDDSLRLCVVPGSSHMCSNVSNHLRCLCWQETHLCTVTVRGGCWFLLNTSQSTVLLPGHDA